MPVHAANRTITQVLITQGAAGALDLVSAAAGLKIYVVNFMITMSVAGTIKFTEGTGPTDLTGAMSVTTGGVLTRGNSWAAPVLFTNTAGVKLGLTSTTGVAAGYLHYFYDV